MKILVAEDHPDSRYLLQQLFGTLGHDVAVVADGLEVIEVLNLAQWGPPEVIVSDALMPRMDGFQLCRVLRQHPRWCQLPFVFYTATYTDHADEQFAHRIGADRFIIKPVDPELLMGMIQETVDRVKASPPRSPAPLTADPGMLEEYARRLSLKLELKVAELEGANNDMRASERAVKELNEELKLTIQNLRQEVAERQAAEGKLRLREQVLSLAQNLGQVGSYERDPAETKMTWSEAAFRIVGCDPIEGGVTREWMLQRIHPEDRERVLSVLRAADETMAGLEVEHRILRPDGTTRHVFVRRHVYREPDGRPRRVIGIIQDITERRQAEAQRARLESQLRQAQKMEAVGNLAGGIAHDFNNILTAIMAHAELLELELPRELAPQHVRESVQEILTASARARDMVRQILTFSRKQPVERKRIEIDATAQEALKLVRATLPANVEIKSEFNSGRSVLANEAQIHQIMFNLCTNAAQSLGERGGEVNVSLSVAEINDARARSRPPLRVGEHVLLKVSDNGCGMDAGTLERIFEPFFTTKAVGQGTGLGLAVVHGIVQAHEGAVFVESTPGRGTTFSLYLPALTGAAPTKAGLPAAHPQGGGEKILFVDDEPSVAKIGARLLERLGYHAVALTDSVAARDRLVNNPDEFDLVITDYLMPRITGLDLSKAAWAVRPDLPMILAVGFGGQLDATKAKAHGFREFVAKPFAIQTLADAIARALAAK